MDKYLKDIALPITDAFYNADAINKGRILGLLQAMIEELGPDTGLTPQQIKNIADEIPVNHLLP